MSIGETHESREYCESYEACTGHSHSEGARAGYLRSTRVVETALGDEDVIAVDAVDQPVFVSNPSGPVALEAVAQRFRLADPLVSVPRNILERVVDSAHQFAIG